MTATHIIIPDKINLGTEENPRLYDVTAISASAFQNNDDIVAVSLPAGIQTLPSSAFSGCDNLRLIVLESLGKLATIPRELRLRVHEPELRGPACVRGPDRQLCVL